MELRTWKRDYYVVEEVEFDGDLHEFEIILNGDVVATITPHTIEQMEQVIEDLDNGYDVNGWEDGMGNTIYVAKEVEIEEYIETKENFPIQDESYIVGRGANGKYFFCWGYEYPNGLDEVPSYDIPDGENGIEWFETKEEALEAMQEAVDACE